MDFCVAPAKTLPSTTSLDISNQAPSRMEPAACRRCCLTSYAGTEVQDLVLDRLDDER